ncbi:LOW QUALITY PROTEIN: gasdermin-E-like [Sphaerodactylus townsendi]|uniref:LOW QUALITY PROTEIN: gasdermin-E-like n=1 Tax=Sphaerodactylus townsendi TaxID=933632 RepID=UPI0020266B62|nr:LOW QUALITY PROTEIN: gasdermin-E-like [Sphaerodactylus townsendi]
MFKRLAKQLIQELDSERKLIPLTSLAYAENFRPLSLVTKVASRLPWHSRKYSPTPFKLADILREGATMEIELKYSEPLLFSVSMSKKSGARLNLKIQSAGVNIGGLGATCLSSSPVLVRKTYMDTRDLWKVKTSLGLIQQIYPKLQLYVVTEVFEIMEPLLIEEAVQGGGQGEVTVVEIFKIEGLDTRMKRKYLQIPRGTVVAYVVEKLRTAEEDLLFNCRLSQEKSVSRLTYDAFQDELGSSLIDKDVKLELSLAGGVANRSMLELLNEDLRPQVETLLSRLEIFQTTEKRESCDLWRPLHFLCSSVEDLDYELMPLLEAILEKKKIAKHLEMSLKHRARRLITCQWNSKACSDLAGNLCHSTLYALQILSEN